MKSTLRRITGLAVALLIVSRFPVSLAHPTSELLASPAKGDVRASARVMLAVSRAGERLVAVGEHGIILLSDDNGKTWMQAKAVPVSVTLTKVRFVNATHGWAVGHSGVVLNTTDGGRTWGLQLDGIQAAVLVHEAAAARTAKDGNEARGALAEADQLVADGPDKPFLDVYFADEQRGLLARAYGLAFATEDGGKHWNPISQRIPNQNGRHLYGISAAGNALFIAGEQGTLFWSTDGWKSFRQISTPYSGTYFGVVAADENAIVVFGLRGNAYRSVDAGETWQKIDSGSAAALTSGLRLSDGALLLVNQAGEVFQGRDAGSRLRRMALGRALPFTGVAQAADGSLVLSGVRGVTRVAVPNSLAEQKQ